MFTIFTKMCCSIWRPRPKISACVADLREPFNTKCRNQMGIEDPAKIERRTEKKIVTRIEKEIVIETDDGKLIFIVNKFDLQFFLIRKSRSRSRDRKRRSRSKDRHREKGRERERDRDRDRDRERRRRSRSRERRRSPRRRSPPRERPRNYEFSPEERDARTVFCMQLSQRIRPRDLEEFFSSVGRVYDVRLIADGRTGRYT